VGPVAFCAWVKYSITRIKWITIQQVALSRNLRISALGTKTGSAGIWWRHCIQTPFSKTGINRNLGVFCSWLLLFLDGAHKLKTKVNGKSLSRGFGLLHIGWVSVLQTFEVLMHCV